MKPIAVVALGGNALIRRGEPLTAEVQRKNAKIAAKDIVKLHQTHKVVVVHGNGPQVGLLALQNEQCDAAAPYPFDILVAQTQGMIGHIITQEVVHAQPYTKVSTVLTHVIIDENDSAFEHPTKPIGPVYDEAQAAHLAKNTGWSLQKDGAYFRRVVASPKPVRVLEMQTITSLLEQDHVIFAAGGGGVPIIMQDGRWTGIEAVIDKDATAALLAEQLGADVFVILTDGDGIFDDFGTPKQKKLDDVSLKDLAARSFDAGSMQPKVNALMQFVERTGNTAAVGDLSKGSASIIHGLSGTRVHL